MQTGLRMRGRREVCIETGSELMLSSGAVSTALQRIHGEGEAAEWAAELLLGDKSLVFSDKDACF